MVAVFYDYYGDMGAAGDVYYFPVFGAYEILDYSGYTMDTVVFLGNVYGMDITGLYYWNDADPWFWNYQTKM